MAPRDPPEKNTERQPSGSLPTLRPDGPLSLNREDLLRFFERKGELQGSLVVIAGTSADIGATLLVEQQAVIGREQCDLKLADVRISRRHAVVEQRAAANFVVRDEGSTNGTLLNGTPVQGELPLREGDKIICGSTVIKFTLVDPTEASYLRQIDQMVGRDELTGLLAKHRFDAAFAESLSLARHADIPLSVMMMDMDHLKALNDRHGHHVGAATIAEVGRIIGRLLRGRGRACRFGGDEFSAFLPGADLQLALLTAEQIRAKVEHTELAPSESEVKVTISIGVAQRPPEVSEAHALLELADRALYRAKARGRNAVSA